MANKCFALLGEVPIRPPCGPSGMRHKALEMTQWLNSSTNTLIIPKSKGRRLVEVWCVTFQKAAPCLVALDYKQLILAPCPPQSDQDPKPLVSSSFNLSSVPCSLHSHQSQLHIKFHKKTFTTQIERVPKKPDYPNTWQKEQNLILVKVLPHHRGSTMEAEDEAAVLRVENGPHNGAPSALYAHCKAGKIIFSLPV